MTETPRGSAACSAGPPKCDRQPPPGHSLCSEHALPASERGRARAAYVSAPDYYRRALIAEGRIRAALALLDKFDPTCGSARTRTFAADLHHILDGKP